MYRVHGLYAQVPLHNLWFILYFNPAGVTSLLILSFFTNIKQFIEDPSLITRLFLVTTIQQILIPYYLIFPLLFSLAHLPSGHCFLTTNYPLLHEFSVGVLQNSMFNHSPFQFSFRSYNSLPVRTLASDPKLVYYFLFKALKALITNLLFLFLLCSVCRMCMYL